MFNPEARWDRRFPSQEDPKDTISVCAFFNKAKITPRFFIRKNKLIKIKKLNYFWQERKGEAVLSVFSVETNCGTFQISFNNKNFIWKLDREID